MKCGNIFKATENSACHTEHVWMLALMINQFMILDAFHLSGGSRETGVDRIKSLLSGTFVGQINEQCQYGGRTLCAEAQVDMGARRMRGF